MAKLYPPVIEGTIPAFNGTTLVVPFSMNRAVSEADIGGFSVKIKTVQSNNFVATIDNGVLVNGCAQFDISGVWTPRAGQYYKLQLAYIGVDGVLGYYSTVGVVKYCAITNDNITIEGVEATSRNIFKHEYTGVYEHADDPMEKVYQYRFILYKDDEIDTDSGWLLHNAIADMATDISVDTYEFFDDLDEDGDYGVQYQIITTNELTLQTSIYPLSPALQFEQTYNFTFKAVMDNEGFDNGYVKLIIIGNSDDNGDERNVGGKFKIYRSNVQTPKRWEPIFNFVLQNEKPSKYIWKDFTVEHGETYRYKICQYNDYGVLSTGAYTDEVYADFEDMFLYDGKRQLKIQFNPKVSSFKNDILESKLDTIGSKYPFFFRNGHVHYKEFPISGLISYWVDNEELFKPLEEMYLDNEDLVRNTTPSDKDAFTQSPEWNQDSWGAGTEYMYDKHFKTKNLLNYNLAAEKKFKLDVLEWLTNGKPKLFRSPVEGNYIVRLMNTSLTPNDTLGRMLHTFQSTAYEIDDLTYKNLGIYGFLNNGGDGGEDSTTNGVDFALNNEPRLRFKTVQLKKLIQDLEEKRGSEIDADEVISVFTDPTGKEDGIIAQSIFIEDCEYKDKFVIDGEDTYIGITQSYNIDNLHPIYSLTFTKNDIAALRREVSQYADIDNDPRVTFSYYSDFVSNTKFDMVVDLTTGNVPVLQLTYGGDPGDATSFANENLITSLSNDMMEVVDYPYIAFEKAPVEEIYTVVDFNRFTDADYTTTITNFDKLFTFDRMGWGRKGEVARDKWLNGDDVSPLENIQGSPFYIFKIKPITLSNVDFDIQLPDLEEFISDTIARYYGSVQAEAYLLEPTREQYDAFVNDENVSLKQEDKDKLWKYLIYRQYILGFFAKHVKVYTEITLQRDSEPTLRYRWLLTENSEDGEYSEYVEETTHCYYNSSYGCYVFNDIPDEELTEEELRSYKVYEKTIKEWIGYDLEKLHFLYDFDLISFDEDWYLTLNTDGSIKFFKGDNYSAKVYINTGYTDGIDPTDETIPFLDLEDAVQPIVFYDLDSITDLYFGYGVICSLSYNYIKTTYDFESDDSKIATIKQQYLNAIDEYKTLIDNYTEGNVDPTEEEYDSENIVKYIDDKYNKYVKEVKNYLAEWEAENI